MTSAYNFSRSQVQAGKYGFENLKLTLFSPMMLLLLLGLLFTFFMTASGKNSYLNDPMKDREIIKTETARENENKASALRYERIVTSADPIRSMLQ